MPFRHILIVALFIVQLVVAVGLVVAVTGQPDIEIDEDTLAAAERAYRQRDSERPAPSQPDIQPSASAPDRGGSAERAPEPERDRERTRERRQPQVTTSSPDEDEGDDELEVDDVREPFDSGQFMEALDLAVRYLEQDPDQAYVRRVAVTSACATGDIDTALEYYEQMNDRDQRTSQHRCGRYNVDIDEEL